MYKLYSLGYLTPGSQARLQTLVEAGCIILDVRKRAGSRYRPEFSGKRLTARYGEAYQRCKALGNENYQRPEAPHRLTDPEFGIRELVAWLITHDVVLLCKCTTFETCHSSTVVTLLQASCPDVEVVRLP
jgi:hypothetical protein